MLLKDEKWIIVYSYKNPSVSNTNFTEDFNKLLDRLLLDYMNVIVMGDLNFNMTSENTRIPLHYICDIYSLTNLICEHTDYYKNGSFTTDVDLTNQKFKIKSCGTVNTHLSDGHQLIYSVLKTGAPRQPARTVSYRSFKNFNEQKFNADLQSAPFHVSQIFEDPEDTYWASIHKMLTNVIDVYVPLKVEKGQFKTYTFHEKTAQKGDNEQKLFVVKVQAVPVEKNSETPIQQSVSSP